MLVSGYGGGGGGGSTSGDVSGGGGGGGGSYATGSTVSGSLEASIVPATNDGDGYLLIIFM